MKSKTTKWCQLLNGIAYKWKDYFEVTKVIEGFQVLNEMEAESFNKVIKDYEEIKLCNGVICISK